MNRIIFLILILVVAYTTVSSQNSNCGAAAPFCTGQTMNFPATTNVPNSQVGPNYGCLGSQPNPAWYFMQIANSGPMSIAMSANNDIDFICWGPFPNLSTACNNLTAGNIQSCSYSGSSTETCSIANAIAGQFYLLLITNFSNQVQNITFNQNNANVPGAGTTNCGFVCVISGTSSGIICSGQSATISLGVNTSSAVNSYTWSGPNSFNSTLNSNVINNVQTSSNYTVVGTSSAVINNGVYTGTCQSVVTVSVIQQPSYSLTPTYTNICQGGQFFASVNFTPVANPANYTYSWHASPGSTIWQPYSNLTLIQPLILPTSVTLSTVVYSVTVAPSNTNVTCPVTKTLAVNISNPLTPTINPPPNLCNTFNPVQLTAAPGGGTWSANPAVSPSGIFTPSLASIGTSTLAYSVSVGNCIVTNYDSISVSRYYSPALASGISTLCVQDPVFNLMNIPQYSLTGSWTGTQVDTNNFFNPSALPTGTYGLTYKTTSLPNLTVCPASTVLIVPVFNPPTPTINPIAARCTNASTVLLTALPANGSWFGASGVSPSGIQTPSANAIGSNTIIYTAGLGTCVASSSKVFQVSKFNSAALTGTVPHLCVTNNPFNLMGIVQNTIGTWNAVYPTPPISVLNNLFNPAGLATGIYTITYNTQSAPNPNLCPDTRSLQVSVLNPVVPNISIAGPFCNTDSPIQLTVTPATGHWVSSSFLSSTGSFSPALSSVGNSTVSYVIGTSTCNVQQNRVISVEAFVSAAVSSSIGELCTTSQPVNLQHVTLSNSGVWSGAGIIGSSFNPGISGAGKFTITYNTASLPSGLCPDKSTLTVNVFSLAIPTIAKTNTFCNNSLPVQLMVSPVGGIFGGGLPGLVSNGGLLNPALGFIGENVITYSISSGPCIANTSARILIEKFISADMEKYAETYYCSNNLAFNLNSLVQNPGGEWLSNSPGLVGSSMFDPFKAYPGANVFTYRTHSTPSQLLCPDSKTITLNVKNVPTIKAVSSRTSGCVPLSVELTASPEGTGYWSMNDGFDSYDGLTINHVFTHPGTYTVVYNYLDEEAKACSTQVVLPAIEVYEKPKADFIFSPDEIWIANPEVQFTNLTKALYDNKYVWTVEGLNQRYEVNPFIYFPQIGNYRVTLTATNIFNCKDEVSKFVEIKNDFSVFIPNSFTPNYDGLNDNFKPVFSLYGLDYTKYKLEIFDRWGHELFSTNDFSEGWNGTLHNKGEDPLKEDTYVYKVSYKDLKGNAYSKIGDVTLLK
jgi:gliding motility-associated-like protein